MSSFAIKKKKIRFALKSAAKHATERIKLIAFCSKQSVQGPDRIHLYITWEKNVHNQIFEIRR